MYAHSSAADLSATQLCRGACVAPVAVGSGGRSLSLPSPRSFRSFSFCQARGNTFWPAASRSAAQVTPHSYPPFGYSVTVGTYLQGGLQSVREGCVGGGDAPLCRSLPARLSSLSHSTFQGRCPSLQVRGRAPVSVV
jgi:hypothetical protein